MTVETETHRAPSFEELLATADRAAAELRSTAAERDRANATPRAEIELLRELDLLQVQEPVAHGGAGLDYAQAAQITRRIARGDTSIAHLLGYHYAQTRIAPLFGTAEQADELSRRNGRERLFWGGVQNPRGGSLVTLTRDGDGFVLNGRKTFASGVSLGDLLSVTAIHEDELAFVTVPGDREGIVPLHDWDNIGQRLTDSGGVEFNDVRVAREEILGEDPITGRTHHAVPDPRHAALAARVRELLHRHRGGRDRRGAGVDAGERGAVGDVGRRCGHRRRLRPRDARRDRQRRAGRVAPGRSRGRRAAGGARHRAGAHAGGARRGRRRHLRGEGPDDEGLARRREPPVRDPGRRATTAAYGFDRHWRNLRTHTVHDPVAYKAREVGDWALNRRGPEFSLYR